MFGFNKNKGAILLQRKRVTASYELLLFLILFMTPLAGVGIDLYTPSLPAIAAYMQAPNAYVKLTVAFYLLGYGFGQPFFGTFSDSYGRRKLLLVGMIFFAAASIIAAFSSNIFVLLIMRVLQGLGAASSGVIAKSMVTDSFTGKRISSASTYMSLIWGISPIIAPAIGGYLQEYFDWSAAFYVLAGYGFVVFLLSFFLMPETNKNLMPLNVSSITKSYQLTLTHKVFLGSILGMAIVYSIITIFSIIGPFLVQEVLHYTAIDYGHIALIMGFGYFFGSLFNRFLINAVHAYKLLVISNAVAFLISLIMLFVNLGTVNLWTFTVPSFIIFFTGGIIFPNCMGICISLFTDIAGTASAVMGFLFVIATSIVSALASLLKSTSALPIAATYCGLTLLSLLVCILLLRPQKNI